jgi:hypothetical protein
MAAKIAQTGNRVVLGSNYIFGLKSVRTYQKKITRNFENFRNFDLKTKITLPRLFFFFAFLVVLLVENFIIKILLSFAYPKKHLYCHPDTHHCKKKQIIPCRKKRATCFFAYKNTCRCEDWGPLFVLGLFISAYCIR